MRCCSFSPDGSAVLVGYFDNVLKLWVACHCSDSTICNIPALVERDVCSYLERKNSAPLSHSTTKVLERFCEQSDKGFSFCSSGLQLVVSQLDTLCTKAAEQRDLLIRNYDSVQRSMDENSLIEAELENRVATMSKQLAEAKKQLASVSQQQQKFQTEKTKCTEQKSEAQAKTEELGKCRDFYKGELDKSRSVMNKLSSKLKEHRCVSCLTQEDVLLLLQELDIPKAMRESFQKNKIGGKALKLISDRNLRELGMSDINQRKALLHAICNVRVHGCIHVAPPHGASGDALAAWWNADEVWKWLEGQGFSFSCLKGLTGRTLIHLSDEDITQFGLPLGPALELKDKCETLKQSFFSFAHQQREFLLFVLVFSQFAAVANSDSSCKSPSHECVTCVPSDCPPEFLCPISQEIMIDPVIASDGCVIVYFVLVFLIFAGLFMRNNTSTHG